MAYQCIQFTPSSHDETIYRWKSLLKSCGWVVTKSSDGTTANTDGTEDKVTGFGTGTGGFGNANAWFVLQMPNTFSGSTYKRQICVQRLSNGDGWYSIRYSLLGFTKTVGTASTAPTANDEVFMNPAGAAPDIYNISFFNSITTYPYRSFLAANDSAPYGFWCANLSLNNLPSIGNPHTGYALENLVGGSFMFDPMAPGTFAAPTNDNPSTGDIDPYIWHFLRNYNYDTQGTFNLYFMRDGASNGARGWYRYGNSDATYMRYIAAGTIPEGQFIRSNSYNGNINLVPLYWIYPSGLSAFPNNLKGASAMARILLQNRNAGDTLSVASPRDYIVFGNLALPWNGSLPTV